MKVKRLEQKVQLSEGVSASVEGNTVTVKGPKGELSRAFNDVAVKLAVEGNEVVIFAENANKNQKRVIGTFKSHIKNMDVGVTEGYTYKLHICSGHFPMNVAVAGQELTIKNFIGEKVPRKVRLDDGVKVNVDGTVITCEGMDKELVGQTAARIEQTTKRPGFDTRVFQAGIYLVEKAGKNLL